MSLKYEKLIRKMTLAEKAIMMSGKNTWETVDFEKYGIPSMVMSDGPHGLRRQAGAGDHLGLNASLPATCFPTAAGVANSWDEALGEEIGEALAEEAVTMGVNVILGPGLNIKRSPLCGRNFEYFSEDPYHAGKMAAAYVRGIQSKGIAACPKHFAANSQELRRMANDSVVDERTFREIYTTGFEIAIKEGKSKSIMSSYNEVNGVYANENSHMLQEILVDEWGFDGFVVSDWGGSNDHALGVKNGSHLEMPGTGKSGMYDIIHAVENGDLDEAVLDQRLDELLNVIFSTHQATEDAKGKTFDVEAHHNLARKAAEESIVLLKNENNLLPLDVNKINSIAVLGDNATRLHANGGLSSEIKALYEITPLQGIQNKLGDKIKINYAQGYEKLSTFVEGSNNGQNPGNFKGGGELDKAVLKEAVETARKSDIAIIYAGLNHDYDTESSDKQGYALPYGQVQLIQEVCKVNPRTIVVIIAGSPVDMAAIDICAPAVVWGWFNGMEAGNAITDVLTGKETPTGKMPFSVPVSLDQSPAHAYNNFPGQDLVVRYDEDILVGYRWFDTKKLPVVYPFGYGLSYTSFEFGQMNTDKTEYTVNDSIEVSFTLKNTGIRKGAEVAQLYVSDPVCSVMRPAKELKAFEKVFLNPGETREVILKVPVGSFAFWSEAENKFVVEPGEFILSLATSAQDIKQTLRIQVK